MNFLEQVNFKHIHFLAAYWFNNGGIVLVFDSITKEYKCYISGENINTASTEDRDIKEIAAHGSKFPLDAAMHLFYFNPEDDLTVTKANYFI